MHSLLHKLFSKKGIVDVRELSSDEKRTFDEWDRILSEDELTVDKIKEFCYSQIGVIETKWKDLAVDNSSKSELIPYHTVYRTLISVIEAPKVARETLEKYLNDLTK